MVANFAIGTGLTGLFYSFYASSHISRVDGLIEPSYTIAPRAKVSVIVPALNEEKYLPLLLQSIENQTEPIAEVVVADSSDNLLTSDVAEDFGAILTHIPKSNPAIARNAGAAEASGDVLLFCDADVILSQRFNETMLDHLLSGYVCVHPREVIYDSRFWNAVQFLPAGRFRARNYTSRCIGVSRLAYDTVGGYDESCDPRGDPPCREDTAFGRAIEDAFGIERFAVLNSYIGTSARRMKKFGFASMDMKNWKYEARAHTQS